MKPNPARSVPTGKRQSQPQALDRIISGGQTGADRAALDFAIECGIPHGGWCPRGRLAEDGAIESRYALCETPSSESAQRTEWNVRDSDGTVIFSVAATLSGGSRTTSEVAEDLGRPWLHLSRDREREQSAERLRQFLFKHGIRVLNVAGPRRSSEPNVGAFVREVLMEVVAPVPEGRLRREHPRVDR